MAVINGIVGNCAKETPGQVVTGIVLGGILASVISSINGVTLGLGFALIGYALIMLGVCLLACLVPARRA